MGAYRFTPTSSSQEGQTLTAESVGNGWVMGVLDWDGVMTTQNFRYQITVGAKSSDLFAGDLYQRPSMPLGSYGNASIAQPYSHRGRSVMSLHCLTPRP